MSNQDLATIDQPTRQAIAIPGRSGRLKVTGKLKLALDAMVWDGARRNEAAKRAELTDHSLRSALRKPHVKRYYLNELEVLRNSERARNIHRLCEIRDKADNMPAVMAIKAIENTGDVEDSRATRGFSTPGVVIVIGAPAPTPITIKSVEDV